MKYKLKELAQIQYGKDHKKLKDGNIPVFGTGGLMRYGDNYLFEGDSVLIPRKGSLNNLQFVTGKFWTVDTLFWTKIDVEKVIPKYLFYVLKRFDFAQMNVGSAVPSLTTALLNELEVEIPDINLQQSILDKINPFESQITNLSEINDNLLELASALVNHSSQTQGRETTPLNDVLSSEKVVSKSVHDLDQNAYISTTNMLPGKAGVTSDVDLPASGKAKIYKPGDILIANIRPYFKKIWFSDKSGSYSNDVLNFRANDDVLSGEFLWGLLYSDDFFDYVVATSKGTKMPRGDKDAIAKYELRLPDDKEVQRITKVISPMLEMVSVNNLEISNLTQTRDALLSKLID
ncbi:restriction endonuclease subunit S [Weissella confusa]|uniref:restriction endonuclease subunit S n=1 Tax=Weissella confusa TaxID=1583 RepID=UPI0024086B19|nr:restriction endonuclease subunit S [Weissella confusa]WEY47501.1 restriction endonuclease subunit S [Weissella confusa]